MWHGLYAPALLFLSLHYRTLLTKQINGPRSNNYVILSEERTKNLHVKLQY